MHPAVSDFPILNRNIGPVLRAAYIIYVRIASKFTYILRLPLDTKKPKK